MKNEKLWSRIMLYIKKIIKSRQVLYLGVFILYVGLAIMANWSLMLGENLMKWDIWVAEYPNQILMTDALAEGTLPIWNPLMRYGTPHYAMTGTPVWYPITLLLALIGYTPSILAFSYVIHIAIGCFGMFLLGKQELGEIVGEDTASSFLISVIVGLVYGNSGVFLSNAEHIMIIISAAWVPYVFFFMRRWVAKKKMVYAMLTGMSAGMIFLGGYPELFYDTFLFLVPYAFFFSYKKEENVFRNIYNSLKHYVMVVLFTIMCCSISLIPFLNIMSKITRTNTLGQIPFSGNLSAVLSFLLPKVSSYINSGEISMVNYYIGLITVVVLPIAMHKKNRKNQNKMFYFSLVSGAFVLCMSSSSFVHGILYRFFPMYTNFRFPTLNRCFLAVFALLIIAKELYEIVEYSIEVPISHVKGLFFTMLGTAFLASVVANMVGTETTLNISSITSLAESTFLSSIVLGAYLLWFCWWNLKDGDNKIKIISLLVIVIFDVFTFQNAEFPITIATYEQKAYSYSAEVQLSVNKEYELGENRNRKVDFSDSLRGANGLNSQTIVFNKLLDEDGYLSILLADTQKYKDTYLRSIMEQNPEAYFTNDIVTAQSVDYNAWANSGSTPPEQIYVEGEELPEKTKIRFEEAVLYSEPLQSQQQNGYLYLEGPFLLNQYPTTRLRMYINSDTEKMQRLSVKFTDGSGIVSQYEGDYLVRYGEQGAYIDIFFPDITNIYNAVCIDTQGIIPSAVELICLERMQRDAYVNITAFGFNDIQMNVDAPEEGYVTILQAKYDGWKAYVDGQETNIQLVDNCFMGIKVSEGQHEIVLKFRPMDFKIGFIITVTFWIMLVIALVCNRNWTEKARCKLMSCEKIRTE